MPVYLLCFDKKFRHAKHYIGFVQNMEGLPKRLNHHKKGTGSRLMAAVTKAGIGFQVARTWPDGDRNFERKLKNRKKSAELCPLCIAAKKAAKMPKTIMQEYKENPKLDTTIVCPVVETAKAMTPTQAMVQAFDKVEVNYYAQSNSTTVLGRWARIRSGVARLWLVLKSKLVSKQ